MKISLYILLLFFSAQSFGQENKKDTVIKTSKEIILIGKQHIGNKNQQMYIVDGKVMNFEEFKTINPKTIESIIILKDSVAKNHFSGQARNGVIIVKTTKLSKKELKKMTKNKD